MARFIIIISDKERVHKIFPEAATGKCSVKKMLLKILQISQKSTYVEPEGLQLY